MDGKKKDKDKPDERMARPSGRSGHNTRTGSSNSGVLMVGPNFRVGKKNWLWQFWRTAIREKSLHK